MLPVLCVCGLKKEFSRPNLVRAQPVQETFEIKDDWHAHTVQHWDHAQTLHPAHSKSPPDPHTPARSHAHHINHASFLHMPRCIKGEVSDMGRLF